MAIRRRSSTRRCARGEPGVRVVDASVFPCVTSVNPMVTIMMLAERAADLISAELA
jgi:choline dehydrogenase-like flavoprotein